MIPFDIAESTHRRGLISFCGRSKLVSMSSLPTQSCKWVANLSIPSYLDALDLPSCSTSLNDGTRFRKADTSIFINRSFEARFNAVISICDQLGTRLFHTLHLRDALANGSNRSLKVGTCHCAILRRSTRRHG